MYPNKDIKDSNINYVNKDFSSLKSTLVEYAKTYFPNTYRDFNETSPGMMMIEMSAYVGDVLNFYIDQQYREMLLPLAEERRNVVNIAKSLGYKTKASVPSYVILTFKQTCTANTSDINNIRPNYSELSKIPKGTKVTKGTDTTIAFETLDDVDFTISGSSIGGESMEASSMDSTTGTINEYTFTRRVKAISGETKSITFSIGAPKKFLKLNLPTTNVVNVDKVIDSNGNVWHKVEYLAQDKVPIETHYSEDLDRTEQGTYVTTNNTAYSTLTGQSSMEVPVPYSLQFIKTSKRFTVEVSETGITSLVFGNGLLKTGEINESAFLQTEQVGITIPGSTQDLMDSIDPLAMGDTSTLGEAPANTTLTVIYRSGGGIDSNLSVNSLTSHNFSGTNYSNTIVTNESPARGGHEQESVDEIKQRAIANFTTQNRCVTKEDYEARILAMPAKFGNVAKVYVTRRDMSGPGGALSADTINVIEHSLQDLQSINNYIFSYHPNATDDAFTSDGTGWADNWVTTWLDRPDAGDYAVRSLYVGSFVSMLKNKLLTGGGSVDLSVYGGTTGDLMGSDAINSVNQVNNTLETAATQFGNAPVGLELGTVDVFTLSFDASKRLVDTPDLIHQNLSNYLSEYRIISDEVVLNAGKIINFGVVFDVVSEPHVNKQETKLKCINTIADYFDIDKMQFRQPIYISQLEYELMNIDGVRSVNYVTLTQDYDWRGDPQAPPVFDPPLFGTTWDGSYGTTNGPREGFGYQYNFQPFYSNGEAAAAYGNGVILPSIEPAVFELKNSNQFIKGIVR